MHEMNTSFIYSNTTNTSVYMFAPVYPTFKIGLVILTIPTGVIGLVGNLFILYSTSFANKGCLKLRRWPCVNRSLLMTFFVRSLAISDVLGAVAITSMLILEQMIDTKRPLWLCCATRFPYFIFPFVTINNLLVISVDRYYSIFYPFRLPTLKTVKRLLIIAWMMGISLSLVVTSMVYPVRYELNSNQFTIACKLTTNDMWKKIVFTCVAIFQYFIPNFLFIFISVSILRYLHKRRCAIRRGQLQYSSQAWRLHGTKMFVRVVMAFALPCSVFFCYGLVNIFIKNKLAFNADYIVRCFSAFSVLFNCFINPFIYYTSSFFSRKHSNSRPFFPKLKTPNKVRNQERVRE